MTLSTKELHCLPSVELSEIRSARAQTIIQFVTSYPQHTSFEIAVALKMDRVVVARILPKLRKHLLVRNGSERTCKICKTRCKTWLPVTDTDVTEPEEPTATPPNPHYPPEEPPQKAPERAETPLGASPELGGVSEVGPVNWEAYKRFR